MVKIYIELSNFPFKKGCFIGVFKLFTELKQLMKALFYQGSHCIFKEYEIHLSFSI